MTMILASIKTSLALLLAISSLIDARFALQVKAQVEHDLSGPTYGLEGKSSSTINYDNQHGLSLGGTISDLLGPPIKIANGFHNIIAGNNIASAGAGFKAGGALLGLDAKFLEAAGAGKMIKGGLLLGGAKAKAAMAGKVAGPKGVKIASIIEIPVKVVAMKDLAAGKALKTAGAFKAAGAAAVAGKGEALIEKGHALKTAGLSQIVQGANEGVHNIGSMVQKTADNMNTAFKLLPVVWDMRQQEAMQQIDEAAAAKGAQQQQQQQVIEPQKEHPGASMPYQLSSGGGGAAMTGGSLFGGLSSLIPGLSSSALTGNTGPGAGPNPAYAALWNTANPLTNLVMSPGSNPFLLPLASGPLGQAIAGKAPIGTEVSSGQVASGNIGAFGPFPGFKTGTQSQSYDFNFLPGVKYHETVSAALPTFGKTTHEQQQQQVTIQEPVKHQQQQQQHHQVMFQEPVKHQQQVQQVQQIPQQVVKQEQQIKKV